MFATMAGSFLNEHVSDELNINIISNFYMYIKYTRIVTYAKIAVLYTNVK